MTKVEEETKLIPIKDDSDEKWEKAINCAKENLDKLEGFNPVSFTEMTADKKFEIRVLMQNVYASVSELESLLG